MNSVGITILAAVTIFVLQIHTSHGVKCKFYGSPGETGSQMANGENYNSNGFTCSTLPHLPLGSTIQVTNQRNGRSITVKVTDRITGPQYEDTIDLTYGAFGQIADHNDGEIPCSYSFL